MKRILSIILAVLMIISLFAVVGGVSAQQMNARGTEASDDMCFESLPPQPKDTFRFFFRMPDYWYEDNPYTETVGIYWWTGSGIKMKYPGVEAEPADVEGVYYYDVPIDVTSVMWTNHVDGGDDDTQEVYAFDYATHEINTEYYESWESRLYPEGVDSFDGMIYVIDPDETYVSEYTGKQTFSGEWFYYYGDGEYGLTKDKAEADVVLSGDTVDTSSLSPDKENTEPTETIEATDPTEASTPDEPEGTNRYYFYYPQEWIDLNNWYENNPYPVTAGIYWEEGTDACQSFPGYKANKTDVEGIYYYDVPKSVKSIIWNNFIDGGDDMYSEEYELVLQTKEIDSDRYEKGENRLYPKGVDSFDGMIYVIDLERFIVDSDLSRILYVGEWFYYYGNGEYGLAKDKEEADVVLTGDLVNTSELSPDKDSTEPTEPEPTTRRYYFYAPKTEWQENNPYANGVGIYWWEGEGERPQWPGYEAVYSGYDSVYYYDVPKDVTGIIWTCLVDGGEDETAEIYTYDYRTCIIDSDGYAPRVNRFYPEGLHDFDYMIYVTDPNKTEIDEFTGKKTFYGEWYYYYGAGEYGLNWEMDDGPIYWGDTKDLERVYNDNFVSDEEPTLPEIQDPDKTDRPENTYRYYFYMPESWTVNNPYSISAGIYWWEGTDPCSSWPGYQAKYTGIEGIYYYDVPTDVTTIVWNNNFDGGINSDMVFYDYAYQTKTIGTEYYDMGESNLYPDGTDNFDNMIYVIDYNLIDYNEFSGKLNYKGEWFYYYGNGEYGVAENKEDAKAVYTSDTIVLDDVYFDQFSTVPSLPEVLPTETTENTEATVVTVPTEVITDATEPSETTEATKATDPTEASKPSEAVTTVATEPTEATEATEASEPSETATTAVAEPSETTETTEVTETTEATEPSSTVPEAEFEIGDANKDGKLNIRDATIIQKHLAKMVTLDENAVALADFDLNGKVNIKDATMIQKKIAGLI